MPVYFIRAGEHGPIKIGYSDSVELRLVKMQADNHEKLTVIRTVEGGRDVEAAFHAEFADQRLSGEWFSYSRAMLGAQPVVPEKQPYTPPARTTAGPVDDELLTQIRAFLNATGMNAARFGILAVGDPKLVSDIRTGRECRSAVRGRILDFIRNNAVDPAPGVVGLTPRELRAGESPEVWGVRIGSWRGARGLTQAQLAERLGVSRSTIASIEAGHDAPGRDLLLSICRYFGAQLADIAA